MRSVGHVRRRHPPHHHSGNSVFEDELLLPVRLEHYGVLIEGTNAARQLHPAEQINGDAGSLFAGRVEEGILDVLRRLIAVHSRSPRFLNCGRSTHPPNFGNAGLKSYIMLPKPPTPQEQGGTTLPLRAFRFSTHAPAGRCEYDTAICKGFQPPSAETCCRQDFVASCRESGLPLTATSGKVQTCFNFGRRVRA